MASSAASSSRESSPEPPKSKSLKRKLQLAQEELCQSDAESSGADSDLESEQALNMKEKKKKKKKRRRRRSNKDSVAAPPSSASASENEEEVPVVSHAERRKQKKKLVRQGEKLQTTEGGSSTKKRKLKDGSAEDVSFSAAAARPRQLSVWVGNLSFKTTQENLKTFFEGIGEVTRINLPMKVASRPNMPMENKGFAYVDFATPEGKIAAIARSEQPLIGRKLLIKDGDDFGGRPMAPGTDIKIADSSLVQKVYSKSAQKILRQQKQQPAPTLFIGNLPFETTEKDLQHLFESHRPPTKKTQKPIANESADDKEDVTKKTKAKSEKKEDEFILKIRMGTFEDTGACKGFTFIDFSSIDNATSALINLKNHHFKGRDLKVEYAGADAVRRGAAKHLVPAAAPRGAGKKFDKADGRSPRPKAPGGDCAAPHRARAVDMEVDDVQPQRRKQVAEPSLFKDFERKGPRARPTPGAALALAKRETAAIIPSQGKKTTF